MPSAALGALVVVCTAAIIFVLAVTAPASPTHSRAFLVVPTGADLQISAGQVSSGSQTVQIHSLAYTPTRVAIVQGGHRLFTRRLAPNGWAFVRVVLKAGSATVTAVDVWTSWRAQLTVL